MPMGAAEPPTPAAAPHPQAEPGAPGAPAGPPIAARQARRSPGPRHLRLMIALAVVITVVAVISLVKALNVTQGGATIGQEPQVGLIVPHRTRPLPFRLRSLTGDRTVTLAGLEGKPLVVNMWATFCSICQKETPSIASVAARTKGRVTFVGIDSNEPASAGAAFAKRYHVGYLELSDPTASVVLAYGYEGLPVTLFISSSGKLVGENLGALSVTSLDDDLAKLFGPSAAPVSSHSRV
jgi:cytochrome c biogenesis protein CcmG/thiol:disulfide interchange protein DsbE